MPTIDTDRSGFTGRTPSLTVLRGGAGWEACRRCGSTLYPQRRESEKVRVIGGSRLTVEKYRCRCGVGREVRRELAA